MYKFVLIINVINQVKNNINEANIRERLLSDGYGKFDLIETIYPKDEILRSRPRVLLKNIMDRFSIPEGSINPKTFWSWHLRYKKRNNAENHTSPTFFQKRHAESKKIDELSEDWREFNPSDAETLKQHKPLIKVIK